MCTGMWVQYGYFMIIIPVGLPEAAAKALTGSRLSYSAHSDTQTQRDKYIQRQAHTHARASVWIV